jgi:hypothetical protein
VKKPFPKQVMLAAGVLAAVVILCSQAFEKETVSILSKIKTEASGQSKEAGNPVIKAAPADAVTSSPSANVADSHPTFIREIIIDEDKTSKEPLIDKTIVAEIFKTLLRVVISPQAP